MNISIFLLVSLLLLSCTPQVNKTPSSQPKTQEKYKVVYDEDYYRFTSSAPPTEADRKHNLLKKQIHGDTYKLLKCPVEALATQPTGHVYMQYEILEDTSVVVHILRDYIGYGWPNAIKEAMYESVTKNIQNKQTRTGIKVSHSIFIHKETYDKCK